MKEPCNQCGESISVDASKCHFCGYKPSSDGGIARTFALFGGIALCLTGIGAIIGIPLIAIAAYGQKKAENLTPTNPTN